MNKPVLVVMAAGMGSRYGGLKQMDPIGPHGEIIIDYSIFDAKKAGFETVIFVIKKEIETDFKAVVGKRIQEKMNVLYAYQQLDDLPKGYQVPNGRIKPWGTAHAVCAARHLINGPFAVINADDYYGPTAFQTIYDYLCTPKPATPYPFAMVAYRLENTLTENGYVSRGVCQTDRQDILLSVTERVRIEKFENGVRYTEDEGKNWTSLDAACPVSMNLWGFTQDFITQAWQGFGAFLDHAISENPLKAEYFLPTVVTNLINGKKAQVKVLHTTDKWYGITYQEDKPTVQNALAQLHKNGVYPDGL